MSRESLGIALTAVGGLLLIVASLWYLEVLSLPAPPRPGALLSTLGVVFLCVGAYFLTRVEGSVAE